MSKDSIQNDNSLCFLLYVCSKEIIKKYKPFLDKMDLTYTQYITLLTLWEKDNINIKELGSKLYLDSGTLTPLLKKLEEKGYITRSKNKNDERNLIISLTHTGKLLKNKAVNLPKDIDKCSLLNEKDLNNLNNLLNYILKSLKN